MNSSNKCSFECIVGDCTLRADMHSYELRRLPRGRICRLVETRGHSAPATASPLTNLQRAMITAKRLNWIPEETTLESCAVECICL
jgi:hypothetical protein